MFEASLWVAGGLAIAQLLHLAGSMPSGAAIDGWTVAGGVLLGLGAWVNGACVFGTVARLGSGEWAYLLTPVGFYVGCLTAPLLRTAPACAVRDLAASRRDRVARSTVYRLCAVARAAGCHAAAPYGSHPAAA